MKISDIKDFIIFVSVSILYVVISIVLYYVFKDNLTITLFLEGLVLVNLSMWIECNIFIRKFKKRVIKSKKELEI